MKDEDKTKEQLTDERVSMRQRITELEELEAEHRRVEEALRESEAKYRELVENANSIILRMDTEGNVTFFNEFAQSFFGHTEDEILGRNVVGTIVPEADTSGRDLAGMIKDIGQHPERYLNDEHENMRRNDERVWIAWTNKAILDDEGRIAEILCIGNNITECKRAEDELREERNFISTVLDTAGALVVVLDTQGRIVRFNRACEQTTGYSFDEVKDRCLWDVLLIPEEVESVRAVFEALRAGQFPSEYENYWVTKRGDRRWIAWSNTAHVDAEGSVKYVIGTGIDVTERKRAEEERESLQRLSQRLTGPLIAKEVGRIVAAESRRLFGHDAFLLDLLDESKETLSGIYYEDTPLGASEPEEVPVVPGYTATWRDILAGKPKLLNRDKDSTDVRGIPFGYESRRSRSLMFVPICWENRSIGMLSVQSYTPDRYSERDLKLLQTFADQCGGALARVRAEEKLKDTRAQLMQSEKIASLGMLLAGVAHEINTPFGAISSMHNTLMRAVERLKSTLDAIDVGEPDGHRKVGKLFEIIEDANQVIASGTERVTDIVQRLRSFARPDDAELKKVDVHQGIEDTLTIAHHELKHKVMVERNFGDIPPIACYPSRLNQVYLNLLINAVQAIEDKGTITITTFRQDNYVHIQIVDTGVGIPQEALKKIFDPNYTTKGEGVGTGLGLSICYRIVEEHRGEILVESEVGKGTTFTVVLPMNLDEILNGT